MSLTNIKKQKSNLPTEPVTNSDLLTICFKLPQKRDRSVALPKL